ncbi:MAG: hypothetical protein LQ339_004342 [Xanthoria mediterranea]|nr:MAG: hypothetical protein LQ339_004342 [Xanthoria mediterranea]
MHPTSAHLRDPHVQCNYRPCKFPFTRDYDGMAPLHVPTSSGLPSEMWSEEMDRFICFSDAVGETPTRVVILSLKKRFPELKQFSLSELAIERRIYCLDRMENNYFNKGAHVAVQRLESAGITLPPPAYGLDQDMTAMSPVESTIFEAPPINQAGAIRVVSDASTEPGPLSSARYANERYLHQDDPFTTTKGSTTPEASSATPRKSANSQQHHSHAITRQCHHALAGSSGQVLRQQPPSSKREQFPRQRRRTCGLPLPNADLRRWKFAQFSHQQVQTFDGVIRSSS